MEVEKNPYSHTTGTKVHVFVIFFSVVQLRVSSYKNYSIYRLQPVHMKNTVLIVSINSEV